MDGRVKLVCHNSSLVLALKEYFLAEHDPLGKGKAIEIIATHAPGYA